MHPFHVVNLALVRGGAVQRDAFPAVVVGHHSEAPVRQVAVLGWEQGEHLRAGMQGAHHSGNGSLGFRGGSLVDARVHATPVHCADSSVLVEQDA